MRLEDVVSVVATSCRIVRTETELDGPINARERLVVILGDKRPAGGNVLTSAVLSGLNNLLPADRRATVVYGEACRLSESRLRSAGITFKQIPYDLPVR